MNTYRCNARHAIFPCNDFTFHATWSTSVMQYRAKLYTVLRSRKSARHEVRIITPSFYIISNQLLVKKHTSSGSRAKLSKTCVRAHGGLDFL